MKSIHTIEIIPGKALRNGRSIFHSDIRHGPKFFKWLYVKLGLNYPKFFKMDEISQLCFLGTEILLNIQGWKHGDGERTDIVIATTDGCIATDRRHLQTIVGENTLASPSIFVYTLPNIMLGEVCIRHGITGETDCFVTDRYDRDFLEQYTALLFENHRTRFCITGYVNYTPEAYTCNFTLYTYSDKALSSYFS